jgi:hypothetical protein
VKKLPLLISYAYRDAFDWGMIREHRESLDLLVDSGAFTAYKQGTDITLAEYCEWLNWLTTNILEPTDYFTLDVIGNPHATMKNYAELLKLGYKPIPIFTRGEQPDYIEELFQTSQATAGQVGIGGIQMKTNNSPGYLKHIMKFVGNRPVHWLGFTVHDFLMYYRPFSADSINWKGTALFGNIKLFYGNKFVTVVKSKLFQYRNKIAALGFDPSELANDEAWKGGKGLAHRISTASYLDYVDMLLNRSNVKVYPVVNNTTEFEVILNAFQRRTP